MTNEQLNTRLDEALQVQLNALKRMRDNIGEDFFAAVELIRTCTGRVVVSGVGKSGLIGRKMVATFASTGTPSFFLHPTEAFHGDLGMLRREDVVILISYSGETDDVNKLIPSLKRFGNPMIAMTGKLTSTLAKHTQLVLDIGIEREICPHNLAPTTSTLVTTAMGDLLAVALMDVRQFQPEDFARYHPGGSLGKRLLSTAGDLMQTDLPIVHKAALLSECLLVLSNGRKGVCLVMEGEQLLGIITDGDIRRAIVRLGRQDVLLDKRAEEIMTPNPRCIDSQASWGEVEDDIRQHRIRPLVVTDQGKVVGLIGLLD